MGYRILDRLRLQEVDDSLQCLINDGLKEHVVFSGGEVSELSIEQYSTLQATMISCTVIRPDIDVFHLIANRLTAAPTWTAEISGRIFQCFGAFK